jgi:DNA recombination protein RmuC
MNEILVAAAALVAGGFAAWLIRAALARAAAAAADACLAVFEQQNNEKTDQLDALRAEHGRVLETLRAESGCRAAAEAGTARLPGLEAGLADRDRSLTEHKARLAELETRIAEERKAAEEKLALLNEAQKKLSDAFSALSAEALKSNNRAFLELATAKLSEFQQGAKSDLEARQKAVDELVRPIRESLEKVDGKLGEIEKVRVGAYAELSTQV